MSRLFKKPFQPKKAPPRKAVTLSSMKLDAAQRAVEFGLEYLNTPCQVRLGDEFVTFDLENGDWITESRTDRPRTSSKEVTKLQKLNQDLQEENHLLKIKTEVLLDMAAEIYCESDLSTRELKSKK